jgi:hypothetical protein
MHACTGKQERNFTIIQVVMAEDTAASLIVSINCYKTVKDKYKLNSPNDMNNFQIEIATNRTYS